MSYWWERFIFHWDRIPRCTTCGLLGVHVVLVQARKTIPQQGCIDAARRYALALARRLEKIEVQHEG